MSAKKGHIQTCTRECCLKNLAYKGICDGKVYPFSCTDFRPGEEARTEFYHFCVYHAEVHAFYTYNKTMFKLEHDPQNKDCKFE